MSNAEARTYETIVVFDPGMGEADVKEWSKKLQTVISANKGEKISIDSWGKRELPYLVRKFKHGHYVRFKYEATDTSSLSNITNQLRITEPVIKFQSHRLNTKVRKFKGNPKRVGEKDSEDLFGLDVE